MKKVVCVGLHHDISYPNMKWKLMLVLESWHKTKDLVSHSAQKTLELVSNDPRYIIIRALLPIYFDPVVCHKVTHPNAFLPQQSWFWERWQSAVDLINNFFFIFPKVVANLI